jgi:hypothetical protein
MNGEEKKSPTLIKSVEKSKNDEMDEESEADLNENSKAIMKVK